jgi:hypothetical protein
MRCGSTAKMSSLFSSASSLTSTIAFLATNGFATTRRDRRALLFLDAISSTVARDFWAANDPSSSMFDWMFPDPAHTGVYTTKRIMNGDEPILYVFHDAEDGLPQTYLQLVHMVHKPAV